MKNWAAIAVAILATTPVAAGPRSAGLRGNPGQFFGPDDYPDEALRAGQQGRVVAKLWIDPYGKVISCTVRTSSGSPSLDQATCRIALEKVTFTPATDNHGRAIAATYTLPVAWILPSGPVDAANIPPDQLVEMTVSVDSTGEVVACNATAVPPMPRQMNSCADYPVGGGTTFRWSRDGKPVGGTIVRTLRERITVDQ